MRRRPGIVRRLALTAAAVLTGMLVVACLALATPPGQRVLLALAVRLASKPGLLVRVGELRGSLFSLGSFANASLADARGVWLELDGIEYEWQPTALLFGRLDIVRLAIRRATLLRQPDSQPSSPRSSQTGVYPPIGLDLGAASIGEIVLLQDAFGVSAQLAASGRISAADLRLGMAGRLEVRRVDGADGELKASIAYHPVDRKLEVDVVASEPAGGLAATLLQFPGLPPLQAVLKGTGSLDDWHADLAVSSSGAVFTRATARLSRVGNAHRFAGGLEGYLQHLAPRRMHDLLAGRTVAEVRGLWLRDDQINIERAHLASDSMRIALEGRTSLRGFDLSGEASVSLGRADRAAIRLPFHESTSASVRAVEARVALAPKTSDRPVTAMLDIDELKVGPNQARQISLRAKGIQRLPYDRQLPVIEQIELTGTASGVRLADESGRKLVVARASFSAQGKVNGTSIVAEKLKCDVSLLPANEAEPPLIVRLSEPSRIVFEDRSVSFDRLPIAIGSGRFTLSGQVGSTLNVDAKFSNLPAALANIALPQVGAGGTLAGRVSLTGTAASPSGNYDVNWRDATFRAGGDANLPPLMLSAKGQFSGGVITTQLRGAAGSGLDVAVEGKVVVGPAALLDLSATGQIPLAVLDQQLATRGTRMAGALKGRLAISGRMRQPHLTGSLSLADGEIRDPETGLRLSNVRLAARLNGTTMILDKLEGTAPKGGRLAASGQVSLDVEAGLPASIQVMGEALNVKDGQTFAGLVGAELTVDGALLRDPKVAGIVRVQRFDVAIPERLPRSIADLGIEHHNLSPEERQRLGIPKQRPAERAELPVRLDLRLISNGTIFVRGRGIDAQFGGELRLTSDSIKPVAYGEFRMERGRIAILGRRLEFTRGTIGFADSLDPTLDFQATSEVDGFVLTTTVSGRASDPTLRFASVPELPEEEILARLLFNKSLAKLSPVQLAQLAGEIDRLVGFSRGPGVLERLRSAVGVDNLDVTTDKKGNSAVSAGGNLSDSIYLGVQQNVGTSASRAVIDLDITKNIKARGEVGSDGDGKVGIGVEWNY